MSIVKVSELNQTTGITPSSLFLTSYGESNPRTSLYITKDDLLNECATTGSNTFYGSQYINGGLNITGLTQGSFSDSAVVINPTTFVVGTIPQTIKPLYGLFSQTGNSITVSGTTTESTLIGGGIGSLAIPANVFSIGDSFRGDMGGVMNAQNAETLRIRVRSNGALLLDSGLQTLTSGIINDVFSLSLNFTIRNIGIAGVAEIISLGRFSYAKVNNGTVQAFGFNTNNKTTFDTTTNNQLTISAEWGSADPDNAIYSDIFTLNKIY